MISLLMLATIFTMIILLSPSNPIKLSSSLIFLSVILMSILFFFTSSSWMSLIFLMIFVGGIMIMFMILSSLLPNEKVKKLKKFVIMLALIPSATFFLKPMDLASENFFNSQSKLIFFSNGSFETLMLVILLYFFIFVYIISKQNVSLRTYLC